MLGPSGLHPIKMKEIITLVLWCSIIVFNFGTLEQKIRFAHLPSPKYCIQFFLF